jgi:hypothetical protein
MTNSGNNDFERKIKSSLEGYEVPFAQADWNEMESKLNTLPKQNPAFNLHLPKFKWNFSTNVFVTIVVCTGVFFLIYKISNSDTSKSEQVSPASPKITPVLNTSSAILPEVKLAKSTKPAEHQSVTSTDPSGTDTTLFFPVAAEVPANDSKTNLSVIPAAPNKVGTNEEKTVTHMEPVQTNLNAQDPSKVLFYDDMIDPKKGFIYPTKDKAVEASGAQTNVNLGWNDYVIYDPKKSDTLKGAHIVPVENKATDVPSDLKNKTDKKQKTGSKKDKNLPKAGQTTEPSAIPESNTKEVIKDTNIKDSPEPAKSDSVPVKKSHKGNKNPKFTNDKSMLDPY